MKPETVVTSVKINKTNYDNFKVSIIRDKFSLQEMLNNSLYLYLNDEKFREKVKSIKQDFSGSIIE